MGELTEGWKALGEYTPALKSSKTQFYGPFLASKISPKPTKWVTEGYNFSLRSFWQVVELKRSSYDQIMAVLLTQLNWISAPGEHHESSFQGKLLARASQLSPLGTAYYFRVYEYSAKVLVCTFSSKNEASSCPSMRVEAGWVMVHVKLHFLGFWCTEEPPPSMQTDM